MSGGTPPRARVAPMSILLNRVRPSTSCASARVKAQRLVERPLPESSSAPVVVLPQRETNPLQETLEDSPSPARGDKPVRRWLALWLRECYRLSRWSDARFVGAGNPYLNAQELVWTSHVR